jgi:CheY-like chemotaxis protein
LVSLKQFHPDLIILDFDHRDNGKGWELLQLLKMEDTMNNIPILITTTAFQVPAELRSYLKFRYIQVVNKPYDLDTFLPLVQKTMTFASQAGVTLFSTRALPILVVEDTDYLRDALTTVLSLDGYAVVDVENGLLALNEVYNADHCLILLDIKMPIMDGFEFLRVYDRQLRPHRPVIVLSAETDIMKRVLPSFVVDVFPKPYEVNHLLRTVEKYVQAV